MCNGRGYFTKVKDRDRYGCYLYRVPCTTCASKVLVGPRQHGTGKVTVKCPDCNGSKRAKSR